MAAAAALAMLVAPAGAQGYTDRYTFLKAVKERDGNKVSDMVAIPGTVVIHSEEASTGDTALHIVARDRDYTWLGFLMGKGAKVDSQNKEGTTPLLIAAQLGWVEGADLLLRQGANVDLANKRGETPLILAVHRRDPAMIRLLMAKGADPNKSDSVAGYSALEYARRDSRSAALVKLLEAKAQPQKEKYGPGL